MARVKIMVRPQTAAVSCRLEECPVKVLGVYARGKKNSGYSHGAPGYLLYYTTEIRLKFEEVLKKTIHNTDRQRGIRH